MNRKRTVPIFLAVVWLVIVIWQAFDHYRFKNRAQTALLNRSKDITNSLGAIMRSQRRFNLISKERLEDALQDLIKMEELQSIALLNALGEVVASVGETAKYDNLPPSGQDWKEKTVTFVNLVDLGADSNEPYKEDERTLIVEFPNRGNRGGPPRSDRFNRNPDSATGEIHDASGFDFQFPDGPPPDFQDGPPPRPEWFDRNLRSGTDFIAYASSEFAANTDREPRGGNRSDREMDSPRNRNDERDRFRRRPPFGRPPWIPEEEYQDLLQKKGLHGFVLVLSTNEYNFSLDKDLWMRIIIGGFSLLAMIGIGLAWRNLIKSSELQLRLVRASEMNTHLRELNVAAAGLAHETRNPLNIVRGLAQMIARQDNTDGDVRDRSLKITEEVDRVTAQLNEFIEYSKPREPKPNAVLLNSVVSDVERALQSDMEDKSIQFTMSGPEIMIDADETLLRQVVFNLLLNSIQSVSDSGKIDVVLEKTDSTEAYLEIRDDGPGVSDDNVQKIFQPYFTTHEKGTGLGLAVVRQIVMSHGWNVQYVPTPNWGAAFRISSMKINAKTPD